MTDSLRKTATTLMADGKGILAADASIGTMEKRLTKIGIPSSSESRRAYRNMAFTTPGIEQYLSGIILFSETLEQVSDEGLPFPKLLADMGILPGVKVDLSTEPFPHSPDELQTKGLDDLADRLPNYLALGAKFTKWRAVIKIQGNELPTRACLQENTQRLVTYAQLVQSAGLVPIVEPEVLMTGEHSIDRCDVVIRQLLTDLFKALTAAGVDLSATILKTGMVLPSVNSPQLASADEIAERTLSALSDTVPVTVGGIVFLSGGQSPLQATERLNEIEHRAGNAPWPISFSYDRGLQGEALETWQGKPENVPAAQQIFLHRLKLVAAARAGQYRPSMEATA